MSTEQAPAQPKVCHHHLMTSTREKGVYCCDCGEPLVGFFWPFSRNTLAGALLYAMREANA
ncbi:hypothetical protein [Rhodoferax koreensis]|uniref:hypothetical protein n=1 Tax=Rhodoferax koreensis TaxID=1842727 RepID=UPI0012FFBE65|nr:hypothetical protein [Rhodoferax koreense]